MIKKQAKLLKSKVISHLAENKEAIADAAAAFARKSGAKYHRRKQKKHSSPQRQAAPAVANLPAKINHQRKELHHYKQTISHKLINALTSLAGTGIRNFILLGFLSTAVFAAGAYFIFSYAAAGRGFPLWYGVFLGFVVFGASALFGLVYGVLMALLFTIKSFSADMGSLVREGVNRVKNSIEGRIDNITDTITHTQAAEIIRQVFAELSRHIRQYAARTAAGVLAIGMLTGILFLAKNFLTRGLRKIKNKADFFTLLSAKAALILAVILNLNFFAKLALWFGALLGVIAIMLQILIVYWVR